MSHTSLDRIQAWVDASKLSQEAGEQIQRWLTEPGYADFVSEIQTLIQQEDLDELEDAFRVRIEFGTGGIRGKMGPGPNRINLRTIGEAAQGLAQYILQTPNAAPKGVVIGHDTRINSERFAKETATVFAGNGIPARLFDGHRSTPALSFALRETQAVAGVVISASHNPPTDNGFKAYWTDGGQVVPPHDKNIIAQVQTVTTIKKSDYDQAVEQGMIQTLDPALDSDYHHQIASLSRSTAREVSIVYTPMHGVGATSVVPALEILGYQNLHLVEEQTIPDGNFPTLEGGVANPEVPKALSLGIRDAARHNADLVLASDPDADRLGCALPHAEKGWNAPPEELALNGNQIGAVLCHYLLKKYQDQGDLPAKGVVCETIVTTDLTGIIARSFGVRVVDNLLVGFKYIGDVIETLPDDETFLFGTEESHGYLTGSFVRDKDAASAAVLMCECAAEQKAQGKTVRDYLDDIYREFGYFSEIQESTYWEGAQGSQEIARIMEGLRKTPPTQLGGHEIVEVIDRQTGESRNLKTGNPHTVEGDKGNVLVFTFTDPGHTRVTARPSGTEPKIKYYVSATSADHSELVLENLEETKAGVDRLAREIIDGMLEAADGGLA